MPKFEAWRERFSNARLSRLPSEVLEKTANQSRLSKVNMKLGFAR